MNIRTEEKEDFTAVEALVKAAFATIDHSDQTEHRLVAALRKSPNFQPSLSLVAESSEGEVTGYVLMTPVRLAPTIEPHLALALAPVSVAPSWQRKGIGGQLIRTAHDRAAADGYSLIVLLGHKEYYPRFGYEPASELNIAFPFDVPSEFCFAHVLNQDFVPDSIKRTVVYPEEFGL